MEKYENLGLIGEGSYGLVLKCIHRDSGQLVAIKKFIETDDDKTTKRIALREVRMLKQLRHENLVNLIEVFRRKRRLYLVFEYVDHTILDELENHPNGLAESSCRQNIYQVIRAIQFCHSQNVIHRDIKPENILVSKQGVVKLCDFGFARLMATSGQSFTDYVATRWYRAPELLVGDTKYGKEVDIWAIGCLFAEMSSGEPLFPGDSDIDQIHLIIRCLGSLVEKHQTLMSNNPMFMGLKLTQPSTHTLDKKFPSWSSASLNFCKICLQIDPYKRPTCDNLLTNEFFTWDNFPDRYLPELKEKIYEEFSQNPLLRKLFPRREEYHKSNDKRIISGVRENRSAAKAVHSRGEFADDGPTKESILQVFPATQYKNKSSALLPQMKISCQTVDNVYTQTDLSKQKHSSTIKLKSDYTVSNVFDSNKYEADSPPSTSVLPMWLQNCDPEQNRNVTSSTKSKLVGKRSLDDRFVKQDYTPFSTNFFANSFGNWNRRGNKQIVRKEEELSFPVNKQQSGYQSITRKENIGKDADRLNLESTSPLLRERLHRTHEDLSTIGKQQPTSYKSNNETESILPNVTKLTPGSQKSKRASLLEVSSQMLNLDFSNSNQCDKQSNSRRSTPSRSSKKETKKHCSNLPLV